MDELHDVRAELEQLADSKRAADRQWFMKTGPGEYGEGDVFLGITVPDQRRVARRHRDLALVDVERLLASEIHEHRLVGLVVLVDQYGRAQPDERDRIVAFYLGHLDRVNNWDLVDASAEQILGAHLVDRPRTVLDDLAASDSVWERRAAIVATFAFIKRGEADDTLRLSERLLGDRHDLIHKAVGWMLREVGKRVDPAALEGFLDRHAATMPRTTLRYAIERMPQDQRAHYLAMRSVQAAGGGTAARSARIGGSARKM